MTIYEDVVRQQDKDLLAKFPEEILGRFYLAGETGLALQLGHRYSYDFDFFCERPFDNHLLKQRLGEIAPIRILQESRGTLEILCAKTRISFLHYPYPLLETGPEWRSLRLASVLDIGLMKLMALASRGSRKDFIDLYFLCKKMGIEVFIQNLERKYRGTGYNLYHIIKSLAYFEDARKEPMPRMILSCDWKDVEQFFTQLQPLLAEKFLR